MAFKELKLKANPAVCAKWFIYDNHYPDIQAKGEDEDTEDEERFVYKWLTKMEEMGAIQFTDKEIALNFPEGIKFITE